MMCHMSLTLVLGLGTAPGEKLGVWLGAGPADATPAGIIAWACFYAAGGKTQGLQKTIAATLSGVVWVLLAHLLITALGLQSVAWIVIGVVAFLIVMQSRLPALSFIPAGFARAAVTPAPRAGPPRHPHV